MATQTFHNLKKDKRNRIINGLLDVFNDLGYDKTTVADIVKTCHIPRGSFYQYFDDKFDCLKVLIEVNQQEKMAYMKPLLARVGKEPFFDLYESMIDIGIQFAKERPKLVKVWLQFYYSQDNDVKEQYKSIETMGKNILIDLLKKDQTNRFLKQDINLEALASMLLHFQSVLLLEGFVEGKDTLTLKRELHEYIKIIRYGVDGGNGNE